MSDRSEFILGRRKFLASLSVIGVSAVAASFASYPVNAKGKKLFTILHTNDMHSNFVGSGPLNDYDPATVNNDATIGGYSRLAALIRQRKQQLESMGPVLVMDAGDYSMGTAFAAATRELGAELQLMTKMGYDAVTLGNHEFDFGPDGLASSIDKAVKADSVPTLIASNTDLGAAEPRLAGLKRLMETKVIRPYTVIERGGIRFGVIGLMGYDASKYAIDTGGVVFTDPIEAATSTARLLRSKESVDVVIALSHGGVVRDERGNFKGEDVDLLKAVPEIDVVVGGHTHVALSEPLLVNGKPVVQSGKYGENLGELMVSLAGGRVTVESYRVIPIDDSILGDAVLGNDVNSFLAASSAAVFEPRGYRLTQPLVVVDRDWPMDYADEQASTPLANMVTDALRSATKTDIAFTANGLIRAGLKKGNSGVQTTYDIFTLAPLGFGIVDDTAGSAMVRAYFTGYELKNILEFFLIDDPTLPGQYFPRVSGMRFTYDRDRPEFDMVTSIELGDRDSGYRSIDFTQSSEQMYSFSCSLFAGLILVGIPKLTGGKVQLVPKLADGTPIATRTDAIVDPRASSSPYVLETNASIDSSAAVTESPRQEIKEWQAIMDYLVQLPDKNAEGVSLLKLDERASEVRAIKT